MNQRTRIAAIIGIAGFILQIIDIRNSLLRKQGRGAGKRLKMSNSDEIWKFVSTLTIGASFAFSTVYILRYIYDLYYSDTAIRQSDVASRLEAILADRAAAASDSEDENDDDDDLSYSSTKANPSLPSKRTSKKIKPSRPFVLDSYEQNIASEIVHPNDIPVSFDDIGGLDSIISDLQESVIYPLTLPKLYSKTSALLSAPSGVLLYGPPGCGKTMLAKALAHESGAVFINLHISTVTDKWYGDSNKLIAAVFSLARRLQPAIVFIDEIDAVFGTRRSGEHEASGMVKAEMMTQWDGLASANTGTREPARILILGATNRIHDIDEAILRRMPKRFAVGLPDADQRRRIFGLILKDTKLDSTVDENGNARQLDLDFLVKMTAGMSGSDIKETCREAAMMPMREYIARTRRAGKSVKSMKAKDLRGLRTEDFFLRTSNGVVGVQEPGDAQDDEYYTTDDEKDGGKTVRPRKNGKAVS